MKYPVVTIGAFFELGNDLYMQYNNSRNYIIPFARRFPFFRFIIFLKIFGGIKLFMAYSGFLLQRRRY